MSAPEDKPVVIGPQSLMRIGVVVAVIGALIAGVMWLDGRFNGLDRGLERVSDRVSNVEAILTDRVTFTTWDQYWDLFSARNPTLVVPPRRR